MIILYIAAYIMIWITTSIILFRYWKKEDSLADAVLFGMIWPLIIAAAPLVLLLCIIFKIVKMFGYKENGNDRL